MLRLELTQQKHQQRFLTAVGASKDLHYPWVSPASTALLFAKHLERYRSENNISLLAVTDDEKLVACINLNEIVRGIFQSAYLGYFAFEPFAGKGLMRQSMVLAIEHAFNVVGLHRLEANIQPGNQPSLKLIRSLNFRHEGFSPRYLKIDHAWKDHERFALTYEDYLIIKGHLNGPA